MRPQSAIQPHGEARCAAVGTAGVRHLGRVFEPGEAAAFAATMAEIMSRYGRHSVGASAVYFDELIGVDADRHFVADVLSAYVASPAFDAMWQRIGRPDRSAIPLNKSLLRTVDVSHVPAHVPFHQDVAFMMADSPSMNCWVALDDCGPGFGTPSLEVLAASVDSRLDIVPYEQRQFRFHRNIELDLATLRSRYPEECFWHPDFRCGEGILFDQFAPHRTYIEPGMRGARRSMEIRLCPAAAVPNEAPWTPKVEIRLAGGAHELTLVQESGARRLMSFVEKPS
jgi:hypothetical protein